MLAVKIRIAVLVVCLVGIQCGRQTPIGPTAESQVVLDSQTLTGPASAAQVDPSASDPLVTVPSSLPEVFVGAGDIAMCDANYANADATARLLDRIGGTVFALGDNAYMSGTREQYRDCYGPTWGRHKSRTRAVPGNHEYQSSGAVPYFDYYGASAGPHGRGYYSFELGAWHVVVRLTAGWRRRSCASTGRFAPRRSRTRSNGSRTQSLRRRWQKPRRHSVGRGSSAGTLEPPRLF